MHGPPEVDDEKDPDDEALPSRIGELGKSLQELLHARLVTQVPVGVPPVPGLMSPKPESPPKPLPLLPLLPEPGGNVWSCFAVAHAAASAIIPAATTEPFIFRISGVPRSPKVGNGPQSGSLHVSTRPAALT
jgi:hypothetical protein